MMFSIDLVKHGSDVVITMYIQLNRTYCFDNESNVFRMSLKIFKQLNHWKITSGTGAKKRYLGIGM